MTAPLSVLLVDDEPPARSRLGRMLARLAGVTVVGEAQSGVEALEKIAELRPDLVFLDVQMPELDGLSVAAQLGPGGPKVIFATAYDEHALRAFDLAAVDYLVKPIARERLEVAIERARARLTPAAADARAVQAHVGQRAPRMAVKVGARYVVFETARIDAVLAQDDYAAILVDGKELLSDESLDRLAERLDPDAFVRVHRSAIVNVGRIVELEHEGDRKYLAVLGDAARTKVPIARDRLDDVKRRLGVL